MAYLAYVHDVSSEALPIDSVLMVWEFIDVIPTDLHDLPLERNNDFSINVKLGTKLISISTI